ncbi:phosphopantetheine-binding protein [Plantactinospora sp. WMMB782]|uniref:phosphopantetheine-binding protein n=1 Tax=Plantactinospora sp. WMMB782 TaxID=3404121 RepID=UPI003B9520D8
MLEALDVDMYDHIHVVLKNHPGVDRYAAFFVDPGGRRELLVAVVPTRYASALELRERVWSVLGRDEVPVVVGFLPQLPLDMDGSADGDGVVREMSSLAEPQVSRFVDPATPLEEDLRNFVQDLLELPRVGMTDHMVDLGRTSLLALELSTKICDKYDIQLAPEDVFDAGTIRALTAVVERKQRDRR